MNTLTHFSTRSISAFVPALARGALFVSISFLIGLTAAAQTTLPKVATISKIEVTGLVRYTPGSVIEVSGLKAGEAVELASLDARVQRMMDTGLFRNLRYHYRVNGGMISISLQVEEADWNIPVFFDNLVWFRDEEIHARIAKLFPPYEGLAPLGGPVLDRISAELQSMLAERGITGKIDYLPEQSLDGKITRHVFSVAGVSIPVCALRFPGAAAIQPERLASVFRENSRGDYSRMATATIASVNLVPLFREAGRLQTGFASPQAALSSDDKCKNGVEVTLAVNEGPQYKWAGITWTGNTVVSVAELNATLGMKAGEIANGLKLDLGFGSVRGLYFKSGYVRVKLSSDLNFDLARLEVTYVTQIVEGAQYRMGKLSITGLPVSEVSGLARRWELRPGDVYNAGYLREYLKKLGQDLALRVRLPPSLSTSIRLNDADLTVDVTIEFKREQE